MYDLALLNVFIMVTTIIVLLLIPIFISYIILTNNKEKLPPYILYGINDLVDNLIIDKTDKAKHIANVKLDKQIHKDYMRYKKRVEKFILKEFKKGHVRGHLITSLNAYKITNKSISLIAVELGVYHSIKSTDSNYLDVYFDWSRLVWENIVEKFKSSGEINNA